MRLFLLVFFGLLIAVSASGEIELGVAPGLSSDPRDNLRYYFPPERVNVRTLKTDVCIYGGTSAGVVAALELRRLGLKSVIVHPGIRLGGLSAGGLGATDIGNKDAISGLAREFYQRVGAKATPVMAEDWTFEPSRALAVFSDMIAESGAIVYYKAYLQSIEMTDNRISSLRTEDGLVVYADYFIDATYEGDLMAKAGVNYAVGREGNATYGESLNGSQVGTGHQFQRDISPYVIAGSPASGLLPGIEMSTPTTGTGDHRVQAYNFRMTLTTRASNRVPFEKPIGYDRKLYVLLERYLAAGFGTAFDDFFHKFDFVTADKTDTNNHGAISTDFIGQNYDWPDGSYVERESIYQRHVAYQKGLMWFVGNDPAVPATIQAKMNTFGLTRDEFIETGGWPGQLYVREARRMISDYVVTQADAAGARLAIDSVGLAAYGMDSHNCRRYITGSGFVRNEGNVQTGVAPYPISYRAIIPRREECANLAVPVCVSASHILYGSIRMEPVFMLLGQAAANAIAQAFRTRIDLQSVDRSALQAVLASRGQRLYWTTLPDSDSDATNIVDSEQGAPRAEISPGWVASSSIGGFNGANYLHDGNTGQIAGQNTKTVTFYLDPALTGEYDVYLRWTAHANRATNIPVSVVHAGGVTRLVVDQTANGGQWVRLGGGSFVFSAGIGSVQVSNAGANGYVTVDAIRFAPPSTELNEINIFAIDGVMNEVAGDTAILLVTRTGPAADTVILSLDYAGSGQPGSDYVTPPSTLTLASGQRSASFVLRVLPDTAAEGAEWARVAVHTDNPDYTLGASAEISIRIEDCPFDGWRAEHAATASDELGSMLDDDGDGLPNAFEYMLGGDPRIPDLMQPTLAIGPDHSLVYEILAPSPLPEGGDLTLWIASDLAAESWTQVSADSGPHVVSVVGGVQLMRWRFPMEAIGKLFIQARVDIR